MTCEHEWVADEDTINVDFDYCTTTKNMSINGMAWFICAHCKVDGFLNINVQGTPQTKRG